MNKQIINTIYQETLFNVFPYKLPAFPKVTLSDATIKQLHYHNTFEIGFCYNGSGECISEIGVQKFQKGDAEFFFHLNLIYLEVIALIKVLGTFLISIFLMFS